MQKKYQGVICTQRHHTMKILYRYINSSLCHNAISSLLLHSQGHLTYGYIESLKRLHKGQHQTWLKF